MRYLFIYLLCTLSSFAVKAQDSVFHQLAEHEFLHTELRPFYNSPAVHHYFVPANHTDINLSFKHLDQEKHVFQYGTGNNSFDIHIKSFQKKQNNLNLWGTFDYKNQIRKAVTFNETLDHPYLYPYLTTDTVGGDLKEEHYAIMGGLSKTIGNINYAFQTAFQGKQSIRNRDPRTENISANFQVSLSASKRIWNQHVLALTVNGDRYIQKNKISFNSELGTPTIFHETGLGNYNYLLAGTRNEAEYTGFNYGGELALVPINQQGFLGKIAVEGNKIDKKLKAITFPINKLNRKKALASVAYKSPIADRTSLEGGLTYTLLQNRGHEGRYDNSSPEQGILNIMDQPLYTLNQQQLDAYISLQQVNSKNRWSTNLHLGFTDSKELYVFPRNEQQFQFLNLSAEIKQAQKIKRALLTTKIGYNYRNPLLGKAVWSSNTTTAAHEQLLLNNFNYQNTSYSRFDFATQLAFPMKKTHNMFVGINASYLEAYKLKEFALSTGFVF